MVFVAVMMIAMLMTTVLSIDLAYMHLTRTELRTATDAAAKATALELSISQKKSKARKKGTQIASLNKVAGKPLVVRSKDIQFGRSELQRSGKFAFSTKGNPINSVQILGDRTSRSADGGVGLFFGKFSGVEEFEPTQSATATYMERDIVLVVDRSGSMKGRKAKDLADAIKIFVRTLGDTPIEESVGLASYSEEASRDVRLTTRLDSINKAIKDMRFRGATSISAGMDSGEQILSRGRERDFVEYTMIVMTDGQHNRGREPSVSAGIIAAKGVTIHTITFGDGADIARMQTVATIGGGRHHHAADGKQLKKIYRDIALTLSTMMTK